MSFLGVPIRPDVLADLRRRQEQLRLPEDEREVEDAETVEIPGVQGKWWLLPHGPRGGHYHYVLVSDDHTVLVRDAIDPHSDSPTIKVTTRAHVLWTAGVLGLPSVVETVRDLAAAFSAAGTSRLPLSRIAVRRIDATTDTQGWTPTREDAETLVVNRAGKAIDYDKTDGDALDTIIDEIERAETVADLQALRERFKAGVRKVSDLLRECSRTDYRERHDYSGSSWGLGEVRMRLYDKTLQARRTGKRWMEEVWSKSPDYVAGEPVWRVEFQLRGEKLKELGVRTAEDLLSPGKLSSLWGYLAGRSDADRQPIPGQGGWLSYRMDDDANQSRRTVTRAWAVVQGATFSQSVAAPAIPARRRAASREKVVALAAGAVSTYAALAPESLSLDDAWRLLGVDVGRRLVDRAKADRGVSATAAAYRRERGVGPVAPLGDEAWATIRREVGDREFARVVERKRVRFGTVAPPAAAGAAA